MMAAGYPGPLNTKQAEYIRDIKGSGAHLLELINDILDLSKIEAGKARLYEEHLDAERLCRAAFRVIKPRAEAAQLDLVMEVAPGTPALRGDERMVKQILLNLLSNAVKFTPRGGTVALTARVEEDGCFHLSVNDTGIGIAEHERATAFAPFGQVDSRLSRKYAGTGLGLPLVRSMADLHGAEVILDSRPGAGTTVSIRFPAERVVSPQAQAVS